MRRIAVLLVLATLLAACSAIGGGGSGSLTVVGYFSDVNALEHHASVEMQGVPVGHVTHINVAGSLAKLTMSLKKKAFIPSDVTADIRQDSLLGPDVVELTPPAHDTAAPLANGGTVATQAAPGKFQPDFESLVKAGNDLLGTLGAEGTSALARVIAEGAQGFGPEGGDLGAIVQDLNNVVTGYASRTQTVTALIQNLDTFSSTLGPDAQANATALSNLAQTTAVLDDQKDRLVTLLSSLSTVAVQGSELLNADLSEITDQFTALKSVTEALANQQTALGSVLQYLNGHNLALARGVSHPDDFIQVLNDFIVCGMPAHAGGDVPGSPLNSCYDAGNGKP